MVTPQTAIPPMNTHHSGWGTTTPAVDRNTTARLISIAAPNPMARLSTITPRPVAVVLSFGVGFLPDFEPEPHDEPMDAILNDYGVVWPV